MKKREKILTNCPICRSRKTKNLYKSKIDESNPYTKFLLEKVVYNRKLFNCDMKLCLNCLLCFFDYRYTQKELDRLYSTGYNQKRSAYIEGYKKSFDKKKESLEFRSNLIRKLLVLKSYSKFREWKEKAKILDFGGWHGRNIPDIAKKTEKYVLDKSNHKIAPNIIKLEELINNKFDLIMSTHVFEHLVDPLKILKDLRNSLKRNGLIYLEVPADIFQLIKKPSIYEHINFYSRHSIKNLAYMANLEILSLKIEKYPYSYHDTIAYIVVLQKSRKINKIKNNLIVKIFYILKDLQDYIYLKIIKNYSFKI